MWCAATAAKSLPWYCPPPREPAPPRWPKSSAAPSPTTEFAGVPYPVTVSIGVAEFPANGITRDDIVRAADAALYEAKEAGRNQVCLASVAAPLWRDRRRARIRSRCLAPGV